MRRCGMTVECATAISALTAWQPDTYLLVLVEFRDAGSAAQKFCEHVARVSPRQRIGLYCGSPKLIEAWTGKSALPTDIAHPARITT
jgi:hypothetical protein